MMEDGLGLNSCFAAIETSLNETVKRKRSSGEPGVAARV